jgi:serine O-acetyltransferase
MENEFDNIINVISSKGLEILSNSASKGHTVMPSVQNLNEIVELSRKIFFPGYFDPCPFSKNTLKYYIGSKISIINNLLTAEIKKVFRVSNNNGDKTFTPIEKANELAEKFIKKLPELRDILMTDVEAIYNGDPAVDDISEIIYCYPGIRAITNYRIAHELAKLDIPLIPRIITEHAHSETGIDIHPEATIGNYFAIDHGTGIVIGATCVIGNNVKIYQGVTLGAKSFTLDEKGHPIKGIPRHPIVEDNVVIYSGATILGRITIGKNSVVGGNVWITDNIPPDSKIVLNKPL